jgi:hypothetical protein
VLCTGRALGPDATEASSLGLPCGCGLAGPRCRSVPDGRAHRLRPGLRAHTPWFATGLSGPHRDYLAAGGNGFIIGDGRLNYGLEQILEMYYAFQIRHGLMLTFNFNEVVNPAYNRERGPVSVYSPRVHWDR